MSLPNNKIVRFTLYSISGVLFILLVLQFFRGPDINISKERAETDFLNTETFSEANQQLLRNACYDCHSNNTHLPWYGYIAPVSWYVKGHVKHGRGELNFSEWGNLSNTDQINQLSFVTHTLRKKTMPLTSYTNLHKDALLSDSERKQLLSEFLALKDQKERKRLDEILQSVVILLFFKSTNNYFQLDDTLTPVQQDVNPVFPSLNYESLYLLPGLDNNRDIFIEDTESKQKDPITETPEDEYQVAFLPGEESIVYCNYLDGKHQLLLKDMITWKTFLLATSEDSIIIKSIKPKP